MEDGTDKDKTVPDGVSTGDETVTLEEDDAGHVDNATHGQLKQTRALFLQQNDAFH